MTMAGSPALLLDRDGVINEDHGYVVDIGHFEFRPGIFHLARAAVDIGYRLVVVTNQSGIARGYYGEAAFIRLTGWMADVFADHGAALTGVMYCPYHAGGIVEPYARASWWRKPHPGMLQEAARRYGLDLDRSVMVGDQASDMTAARAAGVARRILLRGVEARPAEAPNEGGDHTATVSQLTEVISHL